MLVKLITQNLIIDQVNRFKLVNLPEGCITALGALSQAVAIIYFDDDWVSMRLKNIKGG